MNQDSRYGQRSVVLFVAALLMLNYPLVSLFDGSSWYGIPLLFIYLFVAWLVLILLVAVSGATEP